MNLILLGPPGAGKGTQAQEISKKRGLVQLSTGEMLRSAAKAGTEDGLKAEALMAKGELVPDDVVVKIIAERIGQPDCAGGFILDGFPRTLMQAAALDRMLVENDNRLDAVIELRADFNRLVERIVGRYACAKCGQGYHDRFKRPKTRGVCDVCGGTEFSRRSDDNAETVTTRMMAYYRDTSPLIGYYFCKGTLRVVDGMASIGEVASAIDDVVAGLAR
jgi:adenylate kinase